MKPRDEVMSRSDDIGTMNGECLNGCPEHARFEVPDDDFNFWEFWHEGDLFTK
jgi:hypothetical protein